MRYYARRNEPEPDDYESSYLPQRPYPAATKPDRDEYRYRSRRDSRRDYSREPRRASRHDSRYHSEHESGRESKPESRRHSRTSRDPSRRERRDRAYANDSPRKPRSASSERRRQERRERRAARYAEDPDGEAERQERRRERRARREERRIRHEREREPPTPMTDRDSSTEKDTADHVNQDKHAPVPDGHEPDSSNLTSSEGYTPNETAQSPYSSWEQSPAYSQEWDVEQGHDRPVEPQRSRRQSRARRPSHPGTPKRPKSYYSSSDGWSVDYDEKQRSYSNYDELHWYKYGNAPDRYAYEHSRSCCCGFSRRCTIWSSIIAGLITLIIIIVVAVVVSRQNHVHYHTSDAQVNNTAAFASGGATHANVNDTKDGIGAGTDKYQYYQGKASNFPNHTLWISFEDMWSNNRDNIKQSCGWLNYGEDDSDEEIQDIYNAIQDRANASLVDHRLVLALVLQESHGCVRVPHTTSSGGVHNTGLMQAHNGYEYSSKHSQASILAMVQDGTQGTKNGNGLVQELNMYGDPYKAARAYNSGYIPKSGDLSEAAGATACYVSDVANRLTGWVKAESSCPGSD